MIKNLSNAFNTVKSLKLQNRFKHKLVQCTRPHKKLIPIVYNLLVSSRTIQDLETCWFINKFINITPGVTYIHIRALKKE